MKRSRQQQLLAQARGLYARGASLTEVLHRVEQLLKLIPEDGQALILKGHILLDMGRVREAWEAYARATRGPKPSPEGYLGRARLLFAIKGQNSKALTEIRKAIRRSGRDPEVQLEARSLHGKILQALGRDAEAVGAYRKVVAFRPADPAIRVGLGESLLAVGRASEALRELKRAITLLQGESPLDHVQLGLAFEFAAAALVALDRRWEALKLLGVGVRKTRERTARLRLERLRRDVATSVRAQTS